MGCNQLRRHQLTRKVLQTIARSLALVCAVTLLPLPSIAASEIVTLKNKSKVVADISSGKADKGTFVLINGLSFDTADWQPVAEQLIQDGFTVVRYDFSAQPESLKLLAKEEEPAFFKTGLTVTALAQELDEVLLALGVTGKVNLVGFSYGSAVAAEYAKLHGDKVANTVLLAPLVRPMEYYSVSGVYLRTWLGSVRFWENSYCMVWGLLNPVACANQDLWYDSFYNFIYKNYIFENITEIPENVDEAIYKKSVFHLIRAVRDFDLNLYSTKLPNIHLVVASEDHTLLLNDQNMFWMRTFGKNKKSYVKFVGAEHVLPSQAAQPVAQWLKDVAEAKPELQQGKMFEVEIKE